MHGDGPRAADTVAWLGRARADLRAADIDIAATPPLLADAAFHCQQAAEKALKAFLTWQDVAFRRTHDLSEIGKQCSEIDASLAAVCECADRLTAYAWTFRYPGDELDPTLAEVAEAREIAEEVYDAVVVRLPDSASP